MKSKSEDVEYSHSTESQRKWKPWGSFFLSALPDCANLQKKRAAAAEKPVLLETKEEESPKQQETVPVEAVATPRIVNRFTVQVCFKITLFCIIKNSLSAWPKIPSRLRRAGNRQRRRICATWYCWTHVLWLAACCEFVFGLKMYLTAE